MAKIKYHNGTAFEVVDARYGEAITDGTLTIVPSQVGNPSNLQTTDKTSLVSAINEVKAVAGDSLRNQMNENKRELAHLLAYAEIDGRALGNTGKFYHLMDGFNFVNSAATLDTFKAAIQGATSIGATTATLDVVTGLQVGMEVTIFDDVEIERPIISAINTGTKVVTFASPLTKAFKDKATLCRSSVTIDTTNKLMKFGGWNDGVTNYPVLINDVRYNITPPSGNIDEVVSFVQRQDDAGFTVDGKLSIVASGSPESYVNMTKTTTTIDVNTKEDTFIGNVVTPNNRCTLLLTMNRTATNIDKSIKKVLGAIS